MSDYPRNTDDSDLVSRLLAGDELTFEQLVRTCQGLELEEICNILGIGAFDIRVLIHRARLRVYAMAEHFEETGQG